jgi:hypothetical protein
VTPQASGEEVSIGKTCNYKGEPTFDNKGLECYFMDAPDGGRQGIWIKPDIKGVGKELAPNNSYADLIDQSKLKTYQTPDQIISFSYPQKWKILSNYDWQKDGIIQIAIDDPTDPVITFSINKIANNDTVTIDSAVEDLINGLITKSSSTVSESTYTADGSIKVDTAPLDNLNGEGEHYLFFKKSDYYIEVEALKTGYALWDFPIEYILDTIKIK